MNRTKSKSGARSNLLLAIPFMLMGLLFAVLSCEPQEDAELISEAEINPEEIYKDKHSEVFDVVENMPSPEGGKEGWNEYLSENIVYPSEAKAKRIEGTVYVEFIVNADGTIGNVEVLRGIGGGCDEEALKAVRNSPTWESGTQRGKKVNVKMRLPIRFALDKEEQAENPR